MNLSNYRPISLKRFILQIFEKILNDQMIIYFVHISVWFQSKTDLSLPYLNDKILKGFDNGFLTGMILIDLQKRFDTIDHNAVYS